MKDLAISAAQPVYINSGELQAVLNARILLSDMNKTLTNIVDGYGGYVVIMENNTRCLIGNSLGADNYELAADGTLERKTADVLGDPAIIQAYEQYLHTGNSNQFVEEKRGGLFASFCEYKLPGIDWIIVSAIPEETLTTGLMQSIRTTAFLVCIAGLLSVLIFFMISRKLLKPMAFPRALALAERAWTSTNLQSWEDFSMRLQSQLKRMDVMKVKYRKLETDIK